MIYRKILEKYYEETRPKIKSIEPPKKRQKVSKSMPTENIKNPQEAEDKSKSIEEKDNLAEIERITTEISALEKKLGLNNNPKERKKYKKSVSGDGYGDDIFEFLESITMQINEGKGEGDENISSENISEIEMDENINEDEEISEENEQKLVIDTKGGRENKGEKTEEMTKRLRSLLNKLSDGNINLIFGDILKLFELNTENRGAVVAQYISSFTSAALLAQQVLLYLYIYKYIEYKFDIISPVCLLMRTPINIQIMWNYYTSPCPYKQNISRSFRT